MGRARAALATTICVLLASTAVLPAKARERSGRAPLDQARIVRDASTELVRMIGANPGKSVEVGGSGPVSTSRAFLAQYVSRFGVDRANQLTLESSQSLER